MRCVWWTRARVCVCVFDCVHQVSVLTLFVYGCSAARGTVLAHLSFDFIAVSIVC